MRHVSIEESEELGWGTSSNPDFVYWRQFATLRIFEIAALMVNCDPRALTDCPGADGGPYDFSDLERILTSAVTVGDLEAFENKEEAPNSKTLIGRDSLIKWLEMEGRHELANELDNRGLLASNQQQSHSTSVHLSDQPTGVPSKVIIEKFKLEGKWFERLKHHKSYSYLSAPVLNQPGSRGKGRGNILWNPAQFAKMLIERDEKNHTAMHTVVKNHFPDWLVEFEDITGWNEI